MNLVVAACDGLVDGGVHDGCAHGAALNHDF